jgi:hypothetical protein
LNCPQNDPACQPECLSDLPSAEKNKFDEFFTCIQAALPNCQGGTLSDQNKCLLDACNIEFFACIIGDGGDDDCGIFLTCGNACQAAEDQVACEEACLATISLEGFNTYQDLLNCIYAQCPAPQGQAPDPACVTQQQQPGGACYGALETCACGVGDTPVLCPSTGECAASAEACEGGTGGGTTEGGDDGGGGTDEGSTTGGSPGSGQGSSKPGAYAPMSCQLTYISQVQLEWVAMNLLHLF